MPAFMIAVTVMLPILFGAILPQLKLNDRARKTYVLSVTLAASTLTLLLCAMRPNGVISIIRFTRELSVAFGVDGMGVMFAALVAVLWPVCIIYSFGYMKEDKRPDAFFSFYTITYGVVLGIIFADNFLTLYVFYEMLTLSTVPLVMHTLTREALRAARKYLYFSLGGSAFAFIGLLFVIRFGITDSFIPGGILRPDLGADNNTKLLIIYVMTFMGFAVKAAAFPLYSWLIGAAVAPTPVTALLHAVAVVKSGAFAIIRVTFYCFGAHFLRGTWAQYAVMTVAIVTIVFGSSMALKERHLKRRLAYSTVANLSYILFGVTLMTPAGLCAAMLHFLAHSLTKITAFLCVGDIMETGDRVYVNEINGFGRHMPIAFGCFTIAALSLAGVPPFAAFFSKWRLCMAALETGGVMGTIGVAALLISAFLTAAYMFEIVIRAFFVRSRTPEIDAAVKESRGAMTWSVVTVTAMTAAFSFALPTLINALSEVCSAFV